ncbi:MAG: hypothetical protein Unbinned8472contig1000_6 [Prokaryotic dsDNA virus sp.]|nr:MAG: hypothetical protein Unbinned8472contig1000_6 [Prokaryotic dsDNA virus sp.]|tara:strand:+ start:17044 stop:17472 length:429 start_codon:yes stop_codon:yes gene_type:complete
MATPAGDVSTILTGIGLTPGTNLFVGQMPEYSQDKGVPHECVAMVDAGGLSPNPKYDRDLIYIQFQVRSAKDDYESGYNLAYSIKNSLLGRDSVTINNSLYTLFILEGDINYLGDDSFGRSKFSFRFRVVRDNYSSSDRDDL